ncbi:uncharacterized protein EV420DRAFT_1752751 [Desarmillaria tabescens]|uniref:Uncharacterized protein n=1 Tax=Armillaria tabescens TaxID=1929756 RepID=A0AA39JDS8_ARMTA|nr:uncharacterized protein EV420DRAFT_1752751 [Desarmillaria tabescens]KAK0440187.1 hypothetical protein EV420DRAFT_1752751 [Desarmillaria tabescens]
MFSGGNIHMSDQLKYIEVLLRTNASLSSSHTQTRTQNSPCPPSALLNLLSRANCKNFTLRSPIAFRSLISIHSTTARRRRAWYGASHACKIMESSVDYYDTMAEDGSTQFAGHLGSQFCWRSIDSPRALIKIFWTCGHSLTDPALVHFSINPGEYEYLNVLELRVHKKWVLASDELSAPIRIRELNRDRIGALQSSTLVLTSPYGAIDNEEGILGATCMRNCLPCTFFLSSVLLGVGNFCLNFRARRRLSIYWDKRIVGCGPDVRMSES